MSVVRRAALAISLGLPWSLPAALAQDAILTPASYLDYETVSHPQVSPDGRQVVYARRWIDKRRDQWETDLWIMDADGSRNRFFARGSGPAWSPDGSRVAYVAETGDEERQIFVRHVDRDGPPTQVTREPSAPDHLRWSPDGRLIGFTRFEPRPTVWAIDMPAPPESASWTPAPRLVDRLHYRADKAGYLDPGTARLFVVPADGGTGRAISPPDLVLGAQLDAQPQPIRWGWTPDGRTVVVEGYQGDDDMNYRDSHIYSVDVASGMLRQLTTAHGTWASPAVSPDGRRIAYTGHPSTSQTYRVQDVYVMNLDGSGNRMISGTFDREPYDREPSGLLWATDNSGVYFSAENEGTINLFFAPLGGGVRAVTTGTHALVLGSLSRAGFAVAVRSTYDKPTDVVRVNLRRPSEIVQLTGVNEDLLAGRRLAEVEELSYVSTGGTRVQGWIVKPPDFDPARTYPMLLEIHGGPHSMYTVAFNPLFQWIAARGYVILYTNPRGSTGYGTEFGNAINYAYPSVDYDDLMAGVDSVLARGYVNERQLFVAGCSGGGVLSSWVIGHTTRFAAAAVRCPVINWLSFSGQTDVPLFTHNFFRKPWWEDPTAWFRQSSLAYVANVKTPTLLMTGVLDLRTPMPQTEEYFAALKMLGVPAAMLRFEGEWHGTTSRPSNFLRTVLYMDSWFRKYGGQ